MPLHSLPIPLAISADIEGDMVELSDTAEWWVLEGYKPQVTNIFQGGFFYDGVLCPPRLKIIATVTKPAPHPFIREDINEVERARILRSLEDGVRVVTFNLTPVTLDELETEFLVDAFPRAKQREPSYICNNLY